MSAIVYILFSDKLTRFYTGATTLGVEERLENHVKKKYGKSNYTQKADDWTLFHYIACEDFTQARKIELHIKRMKSATYIRNLKKYPDLVHKLLMRFRSV